MASENSFPIFFRVEAKKRSIRIFLKSIFVRNEQLYQPEIELANLVFRDVNC